MSRRTQTYIPYVLFLLLAGGVFFFSFRYQLTEPTIADSVGYIQASHQLANGQGLAYMDSHNRVAHSYYTLHIFKINHSGDPNRYLDTPPGVPLLAASLEFFTGNSRAIAFFQPIMAVALVVAIFVLGLLLANSWVGFWASCVFSLSPVFLFFASSFWSEIPSAVFLYMGFVLYLLAKRSVLHPRWSVGLAALGGVAIGVTLFMRFSNLTLLASLPVFVLVIEGKEGFKRRRLIAFLALIVVCLVALLVFNKVYYGGPFVTGYSPRHGWYNKPAFSLNYAFGKSFIDGKSLPALSKTLIKNLSWNVVFVIIGIGMYRRWPGSVFLSCLALSLLLPYTVYAFAAKGINARFIIPALPALTLLAGQGIVFVSDRIAHQRWRWILGGILLASIAYKLPAELDALQSRNQAAENQVAYVKRLVSVTEPNAVVMSYLYNDLVAVYGQRSVLNYRHIVPYDQVSKSYQYDQFENILITEVQGLLEQNIPVYYIFDRDPSLLNSFEILNEHFEVNQVLASEPVYRVTD